MYAIVKKVFTSVTDILLALSEKANIGDLNSDGYIDITDMSILSLYLIGDVSMDNECFNVGDIDGDSKITLSDLARFKQYLSKVISSLR